MRHVFFLTALAAVAVAAIAATRPADAAYHLIRWQDKTFCRRGANASRQGAMLADGRKSQRWNHHLWQRGAAIAAPSTPHSLSHLTPARSHPRKSPSVPRPGRRGPVYLN